MLTFKQLQERPLSSSEKKKREEVAKAIARDNPNMPMDKKMAIATATAKKVAEDVQLIEDKTINMLTKAARKSKTRIKFKSGASEEITQDTAKNLLAVYKKLNSKNKQKFEDKLMNSTQDFMKTVEFAMSKA